MTRVMVRQNRPTRPERAPMALRMPICGICWANSCSACSRPGSSTAVARRWLRRAASSEPSSASAQLIRLRVGHPYTATRASRSSAWPDRFWAQANASATSGLHARDTTWAQNPRPHPAWAHDAQIPRPVPGDGSVWPNPGHHVRAGPNVIPDQGVRAEPEPEVIEHSGLQGSPMPGRQPGQRHGLRLCDWWPLALTSDHALR